MLRRVFGEFVFFNLNQRVTIFSRDSPGPGSVILEISTARVEAAAEPDSLADDIGWDSMTLACIHAQIIFPSNR